MDVNVGIEVRKYAFAETRDFPYPIRFKVANDIEEYLLYGKIPETDKPESLTEAVKDVLSDTDTDADTVPAEEESPKLILDLSGMTQEEVQLIVNVIEKQILKNNEARESGKIFQELNHEQEVAEEIRPERLSEEKSDG